MACIFCRLLAWLQHKLEVRTQNKASRAEIVAAQAQDDAVDAARAEGIKHARSASSDRRRYEPSPTQLSPPGDKETLETLRARVTPHSRIVDEEVVFRRPEPAATMEEACQRAADAVEYPVWAATTLPDRGLAAANSLRAVAIAVSTSPSYPVFVAAVTMAEAYALLEFENSITAIPPNILNQRRENVFDAAVEAGMAACAEDKAWSGNDGISSSNSRENPDLGSHSDSTPILNGAYATESSGRQTSSLLPRQRPKSRPSNPY